MNKLLLIVLLVMMVKCGAIVASLFANSTPEIQRVTSKKQRTAK